MNLGPRLKGGNVSLFDQCRREMRSKLPLMARINLDLL